MKYKVGWLTMDGRHFTVIWRSDGREVHYQWQRAAYRSELQTKKNLQRVVQYLGSTVC